MFDHVSGRYDLLNRIMTLGRDAHWRDCMADEVPAAARVVLDLCTGSGTSLTGLRQPGRLVIGVDVSLAMLELAGETFGRSGWAPRLLAADGFHLPIRAGSVDCVTIAFGIRNLRPRDQALREIARVLRPGGRLVVLEATAPSGGPWAPFHRVYLSRVLPGLGRLSPDPSAYRYLAQSILEFGTGEAFEATLADAGFTLARRRRFMLGATQLWTALPPGGEDAPQAGGAGLQPARPPLETGGRMPTPAGSRTAEWRFWTAAQLLVSLGILGVLIFALRSFHKVAPGLSLQAWNRRGMDLVLWVGLVGFTVRSLVLLSRLTGRPPRN